MENRTPKRIVNGAARTQAPTATNYDVDSTTWVDLRIAPLLSAMEVIGLSDRPFTPSEYDTYFATLELKIILCPFFCQQLSTTYDVELDYTCIYHIKL
ncbi:unnamed protein product [Trifolium pratense]|uniref:Uncharacterized protein n=1 Tax=Trifolium pratense TaxID=57577 RepID=A0ACB0LND4_TRIPR|nr:unnamed protein product [Trifolium pratense]